MNKALFLDRDGTINVDTGYVHEPEKFVFIDGIFEFCRKARQRGFLAIVIASPKGFENSLRRLGAKVVWCDRYADHHRYDPSEILYALNRTADMGADALVTTEKDAVRFPRFETSPVKCLYMRIAIEITGGEEHFSSLVDRICFRK